MKIIIAFLSLFIISAHAEDWTINYKTFHNVIVTKFDADHVEIMFDNGAASFKLAILTIDLQKRFNYDPVKAKAIEDQVESDRQKQAQVAKDIAKRIIADDSIEPVKSDLLTDAQVLAIQARIDALSADVMEKHRIERGNGYMEAIQTENYEIDKLQRQLAQDRGLKASKSY